MNEQDFRATFGEIIEGCIADFSGSVGDGIDALREYAAKRTLHLASIVDQPGYEYAVRIEVQNVAMKAAQLAVNTADGFDRTLIGVVTGALRIGAAALA